MKILIVDDKKEELYLLETLLKGSSYEVVSAVNGAEALEKIRAQGFDMIISDILMPVMDGFQLCSEVKGDDELKDIPFVFYTATYKDKKDEELALKVGANKFIRKPAEPDKFIKIIKGVIRDVEKARAEPRKPALKEEKEIFKLYSERLVRKLEKKTLDLEKEIIEHKRAEEELTSSRSQLRNLLAHLQSVREEERRLIAREIHDELGQLLTALKMDLSWLGNKLPKDRRSPLEKIKSMSKLIDTTLQTTKRISTELRPGLLDDLGLVAAIEWQAEEFQNRTGIKCDVTVNPKDIILDQDRSTAIFRIFQETLTNVTRHANAMRVKVNLREKAGKLELKVRDNGKGITKGHISDPKSFGLIGIRERVLFLGGEIKIKGVRDKGTIVTVRIPLPKKVETK